MCCALPRKVSTSSLAFSGELAEVQIDHQPIGLARRLFDLRGCCQRIRDSLANLAGHAFVAQQHAGCSTSASEIAGHLTHARSRGRHRAADLARRLVVPEQHAGRSAAVFEADHDIIHVRDRRGDTAQDALDIVEQSRRAGQARRQFRWLRTRYRGPGPAASRRFET